MIEKKATSIDGLFILSNQVFYDKRSSLKKLVSRDVFSQLSLDSNFVGLDYSINKKDVIQ
ncbi:MAG: hypothetical protein Ta2A_18470 [Treponemataceae bacterium]|nr:MAG: hypothetical protein Ta2A_18470 [Treponemataceae bacterium]